MSTVLKLRGGSTAEHDAFTGSAREVTVNTDDNSLRVHDGVTPGGNPVGSATSQWLTNSLTPLFVNTTTFTLSGNRTSEFHQGRRVQFQTSAGNVYGTIVSSAYSTLTTIVIRMDGTSVLDAGLSRAFPSILRADNIAAPDTALNAVPLITLLSGIFNAGTPTTKFDVTASRVTTISTAGKTKTYTGVGTKTVDITIQGLGGRDQAGTFAAFAEPNLFYVPDGAGGLSVVASLNNLAVGPTGYSEWAPIMAHKLNGSAQFYKGTLLDDYFELDQTTAIISAGAVAYPASASYANMAPSFANAKSLVVQNSAACTSSGASGSISCNVHKMFVVMYLQPAGAPDSKGWTLPVQITAAKTIAYGFSAAVNATSYSQKLDLLGWHSRR